MRGNEEHHTEESIENGYKEKGERTTENKMERCEPARLEKYLAESGQGDRHQTG